MRSGAYLPVVLSGIALALVGCPRGAPGTAAEPASVQGERATLVDAHPCIWNGDSGCGTHSVGSGEPSLCLDAIHTLAVDAGAPATRATAAAGLRGDRQWIGRTGRYGRIPLVVRQTSPRRFSIAVPADLPSDVRVLYVAISYDDRVLTPYVPYDPDSSVGGDPRPFTQGVYAVRTRTSAGRSC